MDSFIYVMAYRVEEVPVCTVWHLLVSHFP